MIKKWIQKALEKHKTNSLHRQLGISYNKKIPITLLNKVGNSKIGNLIIYSRKKIKVTKLLKQRVIMALNLRNIRK